MGFVGGLIFAFFFIIGFLIFIFIVGLLLLINGLRKKAYPPGPKNDHYKEFMIIGSIMIALPAGITWYICLYVISRRFLLIRERQNYTNPLDKWRNEKEFIDAKDADDDAISALLEAADSGNKEDLSKLFTEPLRSKSTFQKEIDSFFESCPEGLSAGKLEQITSSDTDDQDGYAAYICTIDDDWYHIYIEYHFNDDHMENVGITKFHIQNLQADAYNDQEAEKKTVCCEVFNDEELSELLGKPVKAKLVGGEYGAAFSETDYQPLEPWEFEERLDPLFGKSADTFYEAMGKPNGERITEDKNEITIYYELSDPEYDTLYAALSVRSGYIKSRTFYTDKKELSDNDIG